MLKVMKVRRQAETLRATRAYRASNALPPTTLGLPAYEHACLLHQRRRRWW